MFTGRKQQIVIRGGTFVHSSTSKGQLERPFLQITRLVSEAEQVSRFSMEKSQVMLFMTPVNASIRPNAIQTPV
jgi:hypothetical protein